jgi:hypothetical protein
LSFASIQEFHFAITADHLADPLIVPEWYDDITTCDHVMRAFIIQPEQLVLRSLKLAIGFCFMTSHEFEYMMFAEKAPLLHTLELGCKRAPISASSVYTAITLLKTLRNLKLHLTWVSLVLKQHTKHTTSTIQYAYDDYHHHIVLTCGCHSLACVRQLLSQYYKFCEQTQPSVYF